MQTRNDAISLMNPVFPSHHQRPASLTLPAFARLSLLVLRLLAGLLLALPLIFTQTVQAQSLLPASGGYQLSRLTTEEGLSSNQVQVILQDSTGFMWFGTVEGLNLYNGYEFTIYQSDPADPSTLSNNNILSLYEDSLGTLWVGTAYGLNRYNRQTNTFTRFMPSASDPASINGLVISSMLEDHTGSFWIGTLDGGLFQMDRQTGQFTRFTHLRDDDTSLSNDTVYTLFEDSTRTLWLGTAAGLDRFDRANQRFDHFRHNPLDPKTIPFGAIVAINEDLSHQIWVGASADGLGKFNPQTQTFQRFRANPENTHALSSNEIHTIEISQSGRLWIGTAAGVDRLQTTQNQFSRFQPTLAETQPMGSESINDVYEDPTGIVWLATNNNGVFQYNPHAGKFNLYQHSAINPNSISSNNVYAITEASDRSLWVGTFGGGLNRIHRETGINTIFQHDDNNPNSIAGDEIRSLLPDSAGGMWVGTAFNGLDYFDPQTGLFTHYRNQPGQITSLSSDQITALLRSGDGSIWVGTYDRGLNRLDPASGAVTRYRHDPDDPRSIADDHILSLYQDRSGSIWIGSWKGVTILNPATGDMRHISNQAGDPQSLSGDSVLSFQQDSLGIMWIGTNGGGLNRFDPASSSLSAITDRDGLASNIVYAILAAQDGTLWISTSRGVSHLDPFENAIRNYDARDGLQDAEFNISAAYQSSDGEMFFGGAQGLNSFFPWQVRDNPNIPPVVITSFNVLNQTVARNLLPDQHFTLQPGESFISFEFAALDYSAPEKNAYAFLLEGLDEEWTTIRPGRVYAKEDLLEGVYRDWSYTEARRYVSYANLKPGNYVFRVKGSNSDGVWNETGASVRITVLPPLYQRLWFRGLGILLVAGIVAGSYMMRVKSIQRHNEQLRQMVRERTSVIEQRKEVAEGLRDILAVINRESSLETVLQAITHQAAEILGAGACVIHEVNLKQQAACVRSATGLPPDLQDCLEFHLHSMEDVELLLNRQPIVVSNARGGIPIQGRLELLNNQQWQAWQSRMLQDFSAYLSVPLLIREELYGRLTFYYRDPQVFSSERIALASTFADHTNLAIENANLRAQAELSAAAAERNRLARDLHDAVTQTLFSASLIAEVLPRIWDRDHSEGARMLEDLRQLTRGALAEMRTLLVELRPSILEEMELAELIQQLADAFRGRADIPIQTDIQGSGKLPPAVQETFFRVAQESLNNIARHARATRIDLYLRCDSQSAELGIRDNGIGFDSNHVPPNHFGLKIMRERAAQINAQWLLTSAPGQGTQIHLTWTHDHPEDSE
ncbi:MAG: GAF domain-containing protein [Chloroflexi bacterium]|nr:GAF domain-containing protein [Chloroflexota bacterium]